MTDFCSLTNTDIKQKDANYIILYALNSTD